jgi:hypothetical protein
VRWSAARRAIESVTPRELEVLQALAEGLDDALAPGERTGAVRAGSTSRPGGGDGEHGSLHERLSDPRAEDECERVPTHIAAAPIGPMLSR